MNHVSVTCQHINWSRLRDTYMPGQTRPSLLQLLACHLFSSKPLFKLMLFFVNWALGNTLQWNLNIWKYKSFHSTKYIWIYCLQNGSHFVQASMYLCEHYKHGTGDLTHQPLVLHICAIELRLACHLFGATPLPEPMLIYCQLDH